VNTIGWLFILSGIIIARQVSRGRVMNLSEDLGDAFIAFASGDTQALGEVLTRRGEASGPTAADLAIYNLTEGVTQGFTGGVGAVTDALGQGFGQLTEGIGNLGLAAILLGEKAKGYRWAATGPDYYDCSGLMWRASQAVGYKGPRFTTANIRSRKEFKVISAPGMQGPNVYAAQINDIVLWPAGSGGVTGHMGVITGPDKFYSARSVRSGIGEAKISTFRKTRPLYLRYVGPRTSVNPFK
jgi:NlpC/P60 family protein